MDDAVLEEILKPALTERPQMVEASRGIPLDRDL
jgi:hypothetical protein